MYLSTPSCVHSLLVVLCIFYGIGAHPLTRDNLLDVPADVALVQVKQKAGQRVGCVKTAADQKHQKPVLHIQLETSPSTHGSFPTIISLG